MGRARLTVAQLYRQFAHHDVLTYASAMAFHALVALPPLLLLVVAGLGFLDVADAWSRDIAPSVRSQVSPEAFAVVDRTVRSTLANTQGFWLTAGAALAIWEISSVVRGAMGALNLIYSRAEDRSIVERLAVSIWLALVITALLIGAIVVVRFGPSLADGLGQGWLIDLVSFLVRWGIAAAIMLAIVGLLLRFAPADHVPWHWVGSGALLVVGSWTLMSLGFGAYVTAVVDYESIFGNLALLFGLMTYLYLTFTAFLAGVELDALKEDRPSPVEPSSDGEPAPDGRTRGGRGPDGLATRPAAR